MYGAIEQHHPDQVIHLGDHWDDGREVALAYPLLPFCQVPGNCDGWITEPDKKLIQLGGRKILLAHGHQWSVKQGYDFAISDARKAGANILLFGHTHVAMCRQLDDGLCMLNPGSCRSTYGLITIENGALHCSICQIS